MTLDAWPRPAIEDHARSGQLLFVDGAARSIDPPGWLTAASPGDWPLDIAGSFAATHPDDQQRLMAWFVDCVAYPAEIQTVTVRFRIDGAWMVATSLGLNLLDDPEVGGLVLSTRVEGPAEVEDVGSTPLDHDDQVHWMVAHLDNVGRVRHLDGRVLEIVGRPADELIGRQVTDYISAGSAADIVPSWLALMRSPGASRSVRRCFVHPDGRELWTECTYVNQFDAHGGGQMFMLAYDITVRREQEEELVRTNEEIRRLADESRRHADESRQLAERSRLLAEDFRMLADEVPAAVFRCDADGLVTFHNARWQELTGDDAASPRLHDVVHRRHHHTLDALIAEVAAAADQEARAVEVDDATGDRVLAIRCRSIADADGTNRRIVGSVDDVTVTARLRQEVRVDPLTGLLNRAGLREALGAAVREDPSTVVVFMDLDRFKVVNDTLSHEAGDRVLQEVARRLLRGTRTSDAVARYGGDEFVVVCRDTEGIGADALAARLRAVVEGAVELPGGRWVIRVSIGTARPVAHADPGAVLNGADLAMFADKDERRRDQATAP